MTVREFQKWLDQFQPDAIVMAWDADGEDYYPVTGAVHNSKTVELATDEP